MGYVPHRANAVWHFSHFTRDKKMKTTKVPHIEVVLPVFNEVQNILPLLKQLDTVQERLKSYATLSYLFINDGSEDGSRELLARLYKEREDIRVVDLIHNFGHGSALSAGIDHFEGDIAAFMDADLQDAPSSLVDMFAAWQRGAKTVVAERGERRERSKILFKAFYFLLHRSSRQMPPISFGTHCLLDKKVVQRMRSIKERNRYFPGLVTFSSNEITPIRIDRGARAHGESRVGAWGLFNLAITAILSFSSMPVRMVSVMGLAASGGALISGMGIVGIKLFTDKAIPGWASMMTAMAFGSGLQLLCLGIIGEYIARIYDEVKERPLYLVEKVLSKKTSTKAASEVA
jgi:glycosyltransferase involved in cell wall biosynthesis